MRTGKPFFGLLECLVVGPWESVVLNSLVTATETVFPAKALWWFFYIPYAKSSVIWNSWHHKILWRELPRLNNINTHFGFEGSGESNWLKHAVEIKKYQVLFLNSWRHDFLWRKHTDWILLIITLVINKILCRMKETFRLNEPFRFIHVRYWLCVNIVAR